MPEDIYREMQVDILKTESLEYEVANCIEESSPHSFGRTEFALSGVVVGVMLGFILNSYVGVR